PAAATVNANGTIPDSANVSFNAAGTYYWQAVYGGDVNNNGVTSTPPCSEVLVINKATPSIATTLSSSAVTVGSSVNDSAAFTGAFNPTGTVTYSVFNENTCTTPATVPTQISGQPAAVTVNANGTIPNSASVTFNKAGTYYWQASYGGDGHRPRHHPRLCQRHLQRRVHLLLAARLRRRRQQQRGHLPPSLQRGPAHQPSLFPYPTLFRSQRRHRGQLGQRLGGLHRGL